MASSPLLAAELAAVDGALDPAGVPFLETPPRGVPALEVVREVARDGSSNASSIMATLPRWVSSPLSTCQISGQRAETNSWECEMMQTAPPHSLIATARPLEKSATACS